MMRTQVLFMDVDGTLTDGKLYIGDCGEIMKAFSVKDGQGIKYLHSSFNVIPVILTGRTSRIVQKRCDELGIINLHQGVRDKVAIIKSYEENYASNTFAYIGDDTNDMEAIRYINLCGGITACPADATPAIREIVTFISANKGGDGAVRDFIEYLMADKFKENK